MLQPLPQSTEGCLFFYERAAQQELSKTSVVFGVFHDTSDLDLPPPTPVSCR